MMAQAGRAPARFLRRTMHPPFALEITWGIWDQDGMAAPANRLSPGSTTRRRKRVAMALLGGVVLAVGLGGYWWRYQSPERPPLIDLTNADPAVATVIANARRLVQQSPRSAAAWGKLGMVLFAHEMYADCAAVLAEAERLDPGELRWPYLRGLALVLQQPDDGIAALKRAADIPSPSLTARLRLAEELWKLDRIDEAEAIFGELIGVSPNNPRVLLGQGQILARRGELTQAIEPLSRAAQDPMSRRAAHAALAEAHRRLGRVEDAEAHGKRAAELEADVPWPDPILAETEALRTGLLPRIEQTLRLSDDQRYNEALALIAEVLRDHPQSDAAYLTQAQVFVAAGGNAESAERAARRAITLNPRLAAAHRLLGEVRLGAGAIDDAIDHLEEAVRLDEQNEQARRRLAQARARREW